MAEALEDCHEMQVESYLRFASMKRDQHLKEVEIVINEATEYRVNEAMFTKDEVKDLIDSLGDELQRVVEKELANASHTSALLMRLLFHQAEAAGIELSIDSNALENELLLNKVKQLEQVALSKPASAFLKKGGSKALVKITGGKGTDPQIVAERDSLKEEVKALNEKILMLQANNASTTKSKDSLQEEVNKLKSLNLLTDSQNEAAMREQEKRLKEKEAELTTLQDKITELMRSNKEVVSSSNAMSSAAQQQTAATQHELQSARDELRIKKLELEQAEKQVNDKLNESKQFQTMKKMMQSKSQQVTQLRKRLALYEPPDEGIEDADV